MANGCKTGFQRKPDRARVARADVALPRTDQAHVAKIGILIAATIVMLSVAATACAGPIPVCAAIDPRSLPEPATCERKFASALPDALYEIADAKMKVVSLDDARYALDCAARQLIGKNDPLRQYEWIRRRGLLAYREERIAVALGHFECAMRMAEDRKDRTAIAKQFQNVGSALRRIGDYRGALRNLDRGLKIMRESDDPAIGGMLSNIADVYRELEEPTKAERYYHEAEAAFRRKGDIVEAAHVLNSLGLLALERRDTKTAKIMLETALREVQREDDFRYQLSFYAVLAKIARAEGDPQRAAQYVGSGLALANTHDLPMPRVLHLEAAHVDLLQGRTAEAERRLKTALREHLDSDADRAELSDLYALTLEESGREIEAIAFLRAAQKAERKNLRAQSDQQLGWLRARFESAEDERTIAALRQRTLLLWLAVASTLAVLFALSLIFVRRQQRARIDEAARRARYEEMLARYRREADALGEDRDRLQTLFDSRSDALCLLDADGALLTVNRAACALLGGERERFIGTVFTTFFGDADADALRIALERMEDAVTHTLNISSPTDGAELRVELVPWEHGDGLIVMQLGRCSEIATIADDASAITAQLVADTDSVNGDREDASDRLDTSDAAEAPVPAFAAAIALASDDDARQGFRRALVELMLAAIEAWERSTGQNRIELADRSRIWCINIDDGRLRTRAMERYMSLTKLPRNPRWRDVLRTAYYVLGQCQLDPAVRDELQRRVDTVLAYARRSALV
jgi:two-component system, sensor histidine kinase ChiS